MRLSPKGRDVNIGKTSGEKGIKPRKRAEIDKLQATIWKRRRVCES